MGPPSGTYVPDICAVDDALQADADSLTLVHRRFPGFCPYHIVHNLLGSGDGRGDGGGGCGGADGGDEGGGRKGGHGGSQGGHGGGWDGAGWLGGWCV